MDLYLRQAKELKIQANKLQEQSKQYIKKYNKYLDKHLANDFHKELNDHTNNCDHEFKNISDNIKLCMKNTVGDTSDCIGEYMNSSDQFNTYPPDTAVGGRTDPPNGIWKGTILNLCDKYHHKTNLHYDCI
jgi:hypothetical protein